VFEKLVDRRKSSMTGAGQPQTCSHLIYTQMHASLINMCRCGVWIQVLAVSVRYIISSEHPKMLSSNLKNYRVFY